MLMQIPVPSYCTSHCVANKNMLIRLLQQCKNQRLMLVLRETLVLAGNLN